MTNHTNPTTTVQLPPAFYDDHTARDLPAGVEIKRTKKAVVVELDRAAFDDLVSDATHYATDVCLAADYPGLASSARATLRRLSGAVRPPAPRLCAWCVEDDAVTVATSTVDGFAACDHHAGEVLSGNGFQ